MSKDIISISGIKKTFKVNRREKATFSAALRSLFKRDYSFVYALKGIDLNVKEGEIRGLIGPNGAGKSTLIKIISGVLYPTEGHVDIMDYTPWLDREKYVKNIGVLFGQKSQLWWDIPAIDTFFLNKKFYNIPNDTYKKNLEFFIDLLSVGDIISKPVRQLSLGERMKCEFICALLHEPKLVYLDEPTIGLDILAKSAIRKFIKDVNKEKNTTFIVTTHDLSEIENLCEQITIINKGEKVYDNTIDNLRSYFDNKKIISVKLSEPIDNQFLKDFDVVSAKQTSIDIEVDLSKKELKSEIYKIFDKLPVYDINVNSINIEKVIEQIYKN